MDTETQRKNGHLKTQVDIGVTLPQAKNPKPNKQANRKPLKTAGNHQKRKEARGNSSLEPLKETWLFDHPDF